MESRALLLIGALLAAAGLASSSCSGPDPASIKYQERPGASDTPSTGGSNPSPTGTTTSTAPTGTNNPPPGGGSTFFGNTAYTATSPSTQSATVTEHNGSVAGKDCIVAGCHLDNSHKWSFAGTLRTAAKNGSPVKQAEVRVVGPDGTALPSVYTDDDGNFWFDPAAGTIAAGSHVGVRTAASSMQMSTALAAADKSCNRSDCHAPGGAQGSIYVQ
jgi:hypothetical protein